MNDSAIISAESSVEDDSLGLRERKKQATRAAIVKVAQDLTLEHGFNGFTVEQLCESVGISRRTFFNYFASKEDAVLGWDGGDFPEDLQTEFVAQRSAEHHPGQLSSSLLQDLLTMFAETTNRLPRTPEEHRKLHKVILSEPQLLAKALDSFEKREQTLRDLIAKRESCEPEDLRVQMAVVLVGAILRKSSEASFLPDTTEEIPSIMRRYTRAIKDLIENSTLEN